MTDSEILTRYFVKCKRKQKRSLSICTAGSDVTAVTSQESDEMYDVMPASQRRVGLRGL